MNLRTWARILIAVSFSISGLVETLGATGLVVELSPDGRWNSGIHTLAVSGNWLGPLCSRPAARHAWR